MNSGEIQARGRGLEGREEWREGGREGQGESRRERETEGGGRGEGRGKGEKQVDLFGGKTFWKNCGEKI